MECSKIEGCKAETNDSICNIIRRNVIIYTIISEMAKNKGF